MFLLILIVSSILHLFNVELFSVVQLYNGVVNVTVNNDKFTLTLNDIPEAVKAIGNIVSFNAGIAAATSFLKNTPLPVGAKIGIVFFQGLEPY